MTAFIEDGYTIPSCTKEVKDVIGSVPFEFRPCTNREWRRWISDRAKWESLSDADKEMKPTPDAAFLAKHIVSWGLTKRDGSAVPITVENCDRIHASAAASMINQITGDEAPGVNTEEARGN